MMMLLLLIVCHLFALGNCFSVQLFCVWSKWKVPVSVTRTKLRVTKFITSSYIVRNGHSDHGGLNAPPITPSEQKNRYRCSNRNTDKIESERNLLEKNDHDVITGGIWSCWGYQGRRHKTIIKPKPSYTKAVAPQPQRQQATVIYRLLGHCHLWRDCPQNPWTGSKKRKNKQHSNHHYYRKNESGNIAPSTPQRQERGSQSLSSNLNYRLTWRSCQSKHSRKFGWWKILR